MLRSILCQFSKPFWHSPLQLIVLGIVLYALTTATGADLACNAEQLGNARTAFGCEMGDMPAIAKLAVLCGLLVASLLCGRAANLASAQMAKTK